nr:hypothetical protein [Paeniglutamicibacter sp. Y32M11]
MLARIYLLDVSVLALVKAPCLAAEELIDGAGDGLSILECDAVTGVRKNLQLGLGE